MEDAVVTLAVNLGSSFDNGKWIESTILMWCMVEDFVLNRGKR